MEFLSGLLVGAILGMALVVAVDMYAVRMRKQWNKLSNSFAPNR